MAKVILTREGYEKLKREYEDLITDKREEISRRLRDAIESGDDDLLENAEFEAIKNDQAFIEGRIHEIETTLAVAKIADEMIRTDGISVGSVVTLQEEGEEPEVYTLVGVSEADPQQNRISYESPIGKAVFGKKKGDTVEVSSPGGSFELTILDVK